MLFSAYNSSLCLNIAFDFLFITGSKLQNSSQTTTTEVNKSPTEIEGIVPHCLSNVEPFSQIVSSLRTDFRPAPSCPCSVPTYGLHSASCTLYPAPCTPEPGQRVSLMTRQGSETIVQDGTGSGAGPACIRPFCKKY